MVGRECRPRVGHDGRGTPPAAPCPGGCCTGAGRQQWPLGRPPPTLTQPRLSPPSQSPCTPTHPYCFGPALGAFPVSDALTNAHRCDDATQQGVHACRHLCEGVLPLYSMHHRARRHTMPRSVSKQCKPPLLNLLFMDNLSTRHNHTFLCAPVNSHGSYRSHHDCSTRRVHSNDTPCYFIKTWSVTPVAVHRQVHSLLCVPRTGPP